MIDKAEIRKTLKTFNSCVPFFIAMSDEYRQQLIMDIAEAGSEGINVSNLSAKSKLSRPAKGSWSYCTAQDRHSDFLSVKSQGKLQDNF